MVSSAVIARTLWNGMSRSGSQYSPSFHSQKSILQADVTKIWGDREIIKEWIGWDTWGSYEGIINGSSELLHGSSSKCRWEFDHFRQKNNVWRLPTVVSSHLTSSQPKHSPVFPLNAASHHPPGAINACRASIITYYELCSFPSFLGCADLGLQNKCWFESSREVREVPIRRIKRLCGVGREAAMWTHLLSKQPNNHGTVKTERRSL